LTLSATLTDANGNPLPNTEVTFSVSEYGNLPSFEPTVESNGTVIAPTSTSTAYQYQVATNANGVASIQMTGPVGQTYAYEVTATAPYVNGASMALTSAPAYVEFVNNDQVGLSPYASSTQAFGATLGQAVPITVTLPPNASGQPQANVLVTLSATSYNGGSPYFTNSSGADLGSTVQVATNSDGIAQVMLNSSATGEVEVSVTQLPSSLGLTAPSPTYISFTQGGVPAQITNSSISSQNVQAGQAVTIVGTLADANGNPLPGGQILAVGNDTQNSGDLEYQVTNSAGSTSWVAFPTVATPSGSPLAISVAQGTTASSTVGDLITANSAGNFAITVQDTDSTTSANTAVVSFYAVSDGQVATGTPLLNESFNVTYGTQLAEIAVAGTAAELSTSQTSVNGGSVPNHSDAALYFQPQNAGGDPIYGQNFTFNVSATNGGTIDSVNVVGLNSSDQVLTSGVSVTASGTTTGTASLGIGPVADSAPMVIASDNPGLAAITLTEQYLGMSGSSYDYSVSVPGYGSVTIALPASNDTVGIELGVYNGNTGTTSVTISSGAYSATASYDFTGGVPSYVQNWTPASDNVISTETQTVSFTLEDDQGNPVPSEAAQISLADPNSALWVTAVNGVTLQQTENMGTLSNPSYVEEPTPIPLGTSNAKLVGYPTVNIPGVVTWSASSPSTLSVESNSQGVVTLTLQANGVLYYVAPTTTAGSQGQVASANATTSSTDYIYTYATKSASAVQANQPWQVQIGSNATPGSYTIGTQSYTYQQLGDITWTY